MHRGWRCPPPPPPTGLRGFEEGGGKVRGRAEGRGRESDGGVL